LILVQKPWAKREIMPLFEARMFQNQEKDNNERI
jgi:hypothetical protein